MAMTRKNFARIADGFKYVIGDPTIDRNTALKMINEFCNAASTINPNFNRATFEISCGLETTP